MAFVLAGGRGSRLKELTDRRAKPAVYFGGKTRIIDFALSNALNSGIRKMAIATQYKAHSLIRHLPARLELLPRRAQRISRHPAREPARDETQVVSRHGRRGDPEHRHRRQLRRRLRHDPGRRSHLQDGLRTMIRAARQAARM
jgi:ADP-glucose pyrophosphorylase